MPIRPRTRAELADLGVSQYVSQYRVANSSAERLHICEVADIHHLRDNAFRLLSGFIGCLPPDVLSSERIDEVAAYADHCTNTL